MRRPSHHDIRRPFSRDPARPRRNGSVNSENIVPHAPATSTAAGGTRSRHLPTTAQNEPVNNCWNTYDSHARIEDTPVQTTSHSWERMLSHCWFWAEPTACSMNVPPHLR